MSSRFRLFFSLCLTALLLAGCFSRPVPDPGPELETGTAEVSAVLKDPDSLVFCQLLARQLSQQYGLEILIGDSVQAITPWDYDLESETEIPRIRAELQKLQSHLGNYPEGLLNQVSRQAGGLHLSLVRGIHGKAGLGGISAAAGLQYEEKGLLFIALAGGQPTGHTLYHELFHIMETVVLRETEIYDDWQLLNPRDFTYDYDYVQNQHRRGTKYLQPDSRAFIDTYAMSFPTEDRARLMEYAMTPGNRALFQSPIMQEKLLVLTQGIRQTFDLNQPLGQLLWEQYLNIT